MYTYLLSDLLNYSLLICDDAGPRYAANMKWETVYLSEADPGKENVLILDPRVQYSELDRVEQLILCYPDTFFLLRIADPYDEIYQDHYYYQFIAAMAKYPNTLLLSTYQPKELVSQLGLLYQNRLIHIPYPYIQQKEISGHDRKNKILISGSIHAAIYPYRTAIWRKVTRSLTRYLFFHILAHPGYIDINEHGMHTHPFIKDRFIQYLSRYKFMLLCPSRCNIEFLKFNECAYAGCLPVGCAPDSYPENIKALFLPLRPEHLVKDTWQILFGNHKEGIVQTVRQYLRETRNPDILNKKLKESIENTFHTS